MARSTRKSLAGTAASAARKVISRSSSTKPPSSTAQSSTVQSSTVQSSTNAKPTKKAATKKAATTKASTEKSATTKAAATKAAPGKKSAAKKTAARNGAAKKSAPAKPAAKKSAASRTAPAVKAPVRKAATASRTKATKTAKTTKPAPAASTEKVGALKVKEGEGAWTKAEIKEVLDELHDLRARVVRTLADQEEELAHLMRDAGDGAGQDQADMGATSFERDHELTVVNNEREKLAQIDRALARIADGTYGICESCGNPIGKMRAMAFPRATLCLTCKQREERR